MLVILCIEVAIIWMAVMSCGLSASFPAIIIPAFHDTLSPSQVSMIGSVRQAGVMGGAFFVGPLLDVWGRRKGLLFSILPGISGYLSIWLFGNLTGISIGLFLEGISMGMINASATVFLAEALSKEWRGSVGVSRHVALSIGMTLTYVFGLTFKGQIQTIAFIAMIFPVISFLLGAGFLKETNVWKQQWKTNEGKKKTSNNFRTTYLNFWKALRTRPEVYKPFAILNLLNFSRHSSGAGVITNYMINFIVDSGATTDPYVVAIVLGLFRTIGGLTGAVTSKLFGRRIVMNVAGVIMSVSMLTVSFFQFSGSSVKYVPEIFLALFISTAVIFQSISLSLQGEFFPTEFRGMCSSSLSTISNLQASIMLFAYPFLKAWFGNGLVMMSYGVACVCCELISLFFIPDVDGKSLNEIGLMFRKESRVLDDKQEVLLLTANEAFKTRKNDAKTLTKEVVGR